MSHDFWTDGAIRPVLPSPSCARPNSQFHRHSSAMLQGADQTTDGVYPASIEPVEYSHRELGHVNLHPFDERPVVEPVALRFGHEGGETLEVDGGVSVRVVFEVDIIVLEEKGEGTKVPEATYKAAGQEAQVGEGELVGLISEIAKYWI